MSFIHPWHSTVKWMSIIKMSKKLLICVDYHDLLLTLAITVNMLKSMTKKKDKIYWSWFHLLLFSFTDEVWCLTDLSSNYWKGVYLTLLEAHSIFWIISWNVCLKKIFCWERKIWIILSYISQMIFRFRWQLCLINSWSAKWSLSSAITGRLNSLLHTPAGHLHEKWPPTPWRSTKEKNSPIQITNVLPNHFMSEGR